MSIIKSPYEISIWRDVLTSDGVPKEQKVCVIGSDKMTSQSRAFSPNFVRNANGEKKLSFKMYRQYIDIISGEEVHNPFIDNLVNETKVKLYYEDKWYDFIVKDINENSATHLCIYQLEDALVRELSRNGFGITLDAKLNNNLGDAKKLANGILAETGWTADSEVFVEKVDEALVYIKIPAGTEVVHLLDQVKDENGIYSTGVTEEPYTFNEETTVLAFYSSCKNKPYRFQFIYSDKGYNRAMDGSYAISRKDTRTINEKDCQYYIDIGDKYVESNEDADAAALELYLPEGWKIGDVGKKWDNGMLLDGDSTLSSWYRGDRYGYAQQAIYVPLLEKYCQKFSRLEIDAETGEPIIDEVTKKPVIKGEYLGYVDSKFVSPTLIQNCINNYNFESKAGWTAVQSNDSQKPKVENVYGRFNGEFTTVTDEFYNGTYDPKNKYKAYMKMSFNNANEFVLNSGIRDNRTMIGDMPEGEEWVLDCKILNSVGIPLVAENFEFSFNEYTYDSSSGLYNPKKDDDIKIVLKQISTDDLADGTMRIFFKVDSNQYTKKDFKKSKIYLKIAPPNKGDYYIENIALYRKSLDKKGKIITPDYESEDSISADYFIETGVVENRYHFFKPELVIGDNAVKTAEEVKTIELTKLDYNQFIPVFNEGAKKIRTVSAKESNYFNILQSIAETFEGWLDLEVERDNDGGIVEKKVTFKNYLGETNYANFRYGVNLKEIQRTTSSKNIVSKLVVKQNSNELGQDGFCTIQRAAANPTGENYIYDFQYYHNQGLMDAAEYFDTIYYLTSAKGQDAGLWNDENKVDKGDFNLKGYALRLKKINDAMVPINQELVGLTQSLIDKQAKLEVVEATKEAATSELAAIRSDFHALTGVYPEETSPGLIRGISQDTTIIKANNNDWWYLSGGLSLNTTNKTISGTIRVNNNKTKDFDRTARFTLKTKVRTRDLPIVEPRYLYGIYQFVEKPTGYPLAKDDGTSILTQASFNFGWTGGTSSPGAFDNTCQKMAVYQDSTAGSFWITYNGYTVYSNTTYNNIAPQIGWQPIDGVSTSSCRTINVPEPYEISALDEFYQWFISNTIKIDDWDWSIEPDNTPSNDIDVWIDREYKVEVIIPANATKGYFSQPINTVDINNSTIQKYLNSYATCLEQEKTSAADIVTLNEDISVLEEAIKTREKSADELKEYKRKLNELFFKKYGRFISEGTWISEEHVDDDKYYADAQSVLYNSCYPQVQYSINVLFLSKLPGYELFKFNLGDTTNVIDEKFFGENKEQEVVITEISEQLDDPTQDTIKVQTFKNQFQDLFQKITATVQQTQYNSGSYEKGEKFLESTLAKKSEFITNAINSAQDYLQYGQTVKQGKDGITITDDSNKQAQLRLVGGAILFSTTDPETQEVAWRTGLTNEGISADLITAGQLDVGLIQIISGDGPTFRWDSYGISAYDAIWSENSGTRTITGVNTRKFVRFDKYGIYGIDSVLDIDGSSWYPRTNQEIDAYATFALTWEGLKVTGDSGIVARIGKNDGSIVKVTNGEEKLLVVSNDGNLEVAGKITAKSGKIAGFEIGEIEEYHNVGEDEKELKKIPALYYNITFEKDSVEEKNLIWLEDNSFILAPENVSFIKLEVEEESESGVVKVNKTWNEFTGFEEEEPLWKVIIGKNFGVTNTGILFANGAKIAGEITAEKGKIGGFILEKWYDSENAEDGYVLRVGGDPTNINPTTGSITYDDGTFGYIVNEMLDPPDIFFCNEFPVATLSLGGSKYKSDWRLGIGSNFGVDKNGNLYAKNANLNGHINATSGTLGGLSINGSITLASGGSIVHNSSSCRWTSEGFSLGTGSIGTWAVRPESYYGLRINYVNGSSHPTSNYVNLNKLGIVKNRSSAALGDSEITWEALFHCIKAPRGGSTGDACLNTLEISNVTIDNSTLSSGVQLNDGVQLGTAWVVNGDNLISVGRYNKLAYYLEGDRLKSYHVVTGDIEYTLWSSIMNHVGVSTSDARVKKDIEMLNSKYNTFFDTLQPKRYKYINGTSNRYHTGFIAQEVVQALEDSGLDTLDFAAVMLEPDDNGSIWRLRRDEFVALNTWQIQLLKPRVTVIEEKISQLEAELAELKSKI